MQYARALDHLLREIVFANPTWGHVYMLQIDVSDFFYRIGLHPADALKLGLIFPVDEGNEPLVSTTITLPMGWKNYPPLFYKATETVADLAKHTFCAHVPSRLHKMDDR